MGGKSKSSTSSTNITKDLTTNNVDNRVAEGDASIGGNINVNLSDIATEGGGLLGGAGGVNLGITTSDFGALDTASGISDQAFEFAGKASDNQSMALASSLASVKDVAKSAVDVAKSATQDEGARTAQLVVIGLIVVGIAGVVIYSKGRK